MLYALRLRHAAVAGLALLAFTAPVRRRPGDRKSDEGVRMLESDH